MQHKRVSTSLFIVLLMLCSMFAVPFSASAAMTLYTLEVTPAANTIDVGGTATYQAILHSATGGDLDVTSSCTWTIADSTIGTPGSAGSFVGTASGTTMVTAVYPKPQLSASADLTVKAKDPILVILPPTNTTSVGGIATYNAYLRFFNGDPDQDVTTECTWGILDTSIASIAASKGQYQGLSPGTTTVTAHLIRKPALSTVYRPPLDLSAEARLIVAKRQQQVELTLEVTPATATILVGDSQQYKAILHSSDGSPDQDVTDASTWSLSAVIATPTAKGLYKGTTPGTAAVTAKYTPPSYSELSDDAQLIVAKRQQQVELTLEVTPPTATIWVGDSQQYKALLHSSDGSPDQDVTNASDWSLSTAIAIPTAKGLYKGTTPGTATVTAKYTPPSYSELSDDATLIVKKSEDGGDTPPETENLPLGKIIDRQPGYITLSDPQNLGRTAEEFTMDYDPARMDSNKDRHPKVFYWNTTYKKWIALSSYPLSSGKIKAINDGNYSGWFVVMGCIQPTFIDVYGNWAEKYVNRMNGLGLLEGYPDPTGGLQRPAGLDRIIIRSELTASVACILGLAPGDTKLYPTISFMSSSQNDAVLNAHYADADEIMDWARPYVAAMTQAGLVNGIGDRFAPNNQLTRIEAAVIISNALRDVPGFGTPADLSVYTDSSEVPSWAIGKVAQGTISGYPDGTLRPNQPITRAETCALLITLLRGLGW